MTTYKPPQYQHCPMCGGQLAEREFGENTYQACSDTQNCKWVHWGHTPTTAAIITVNPRSASHVLLVQRGREPFKGMWSLPAGFAEYGELPKDAAERELKEEVSLVAGQLKMVGQYLEPSHPKTFSVLNVFAASDVNGDMKASDDAVDARYFPWNELPEMAFSGQVQAIKDYFGEAA